MKVTEHLLFLALMLPTFALLVLAALSLAQPSLPSTVIQAQATVTAPAKAQPKPVDERGYDATY